MRIERFDNGALILGDCLEVLQKLPESSIDAIVTDPPYGLSFMGKKWDYDVPGVDVWRECLRVLKPGGHLLSFGGTRTYHRLVVNIEDAGFEIRDQIQWLYGSGFPKSLDVSKAIDKAAGAEREVVGQADYTVNDKRGGAYDSVEATQRPRPQVDITAPTTALAKQWQGWGTALKPANEPICLARKPLIGTVADNVQTHGTGALNIDDCRVSFGSETDSRVGTDFVSNGGDASNNCNDNQVPNKHYVQMYKDGGRWPANVIHDGSDEVLEQFPDTKSGLMRAGTPRPDTVNCYGTFGGNATGQDTYADAGSAARFFYCAKASKSDRGTDNTHPTVKPTDLMRYLCKLITPPGGKILDPFAGSGSTGKAAIVEGFTFIGIERDEQYFQIAYNRVK